VRGTTLIRMLISVENNPPLDYVIATGAIETLITFLTSPNEKLQYEAAWALTNIASGTSEHVRMLCDNGAIAMFVHLLSSGSEDVREQAVWALGNIAGDSPRFRDLVLRSGASIPIITVMHQTTKPSLLRNATWTLSNLCRGKPRPDWELIQPLIAPLAKNLDIDDQESLSNVLWALSYISDGSSENIQALLDCGRTQRIIELLTHASNSVKTPALRCIGNIVTGDDVQTEQVLALGGLAALVPLLQHANRGILKETCWTISNITAGNRTQIQAVIEAGIVPQLIHHLLTAPFDVKKEAAWAIANATSGGSNEQIRFLVQQNCIEPMSTLLDTVDARVVIVALEALENILQKGAEDSKNEYVSMFTDEIIEKIEQLQTHANHDIYEKALSILENYLVIPDPDEEYRQSDLYPPVCAAIRELLPMPIADEVLENL
jgi:importin subunit alpha-1